MWRLVFCLFLAASTAFSGSPSVSGSHFRITVVFDFESPCPETTVDELKHEVTALFGDASIDVDFKPLADLDRYPQFQKVVSVKFLGECRMDRMPRGLERQGPLGLSHVSDGAVLPFAEIRCDRVRDLVWSTMVNGDSHRDLLLGRALGRVVAHELYHMLLKTQRHGKGPAQAMLNGAQLICSKLKFGDQDLTKLRLSPHSAGD